MDFASRAERRVEGWSAARRFACIFGMGVLAASLPARADWDDDFDGGFGAPWNFAATDDAGEAPSSGFTTFEVVDAGTDDHLLMAHSTRAFRDGGGGAADVFGWVDESFANVAMAADVNADPAAGQQSVLGLLGRGDPEVGSAYLAAVDFANSRFFIARSDDFIDFQAALVADDAVAIDPGTTYRIEFHLIGSTLSARLRDTSTGVLLSAISVVDTSFASGLAGLLVETDYDVGLNPVAPVVGTFDAVVVVPEPSLMALVAAGAIAVAGLKYRRIART